MVDIAYYDSLIWNAYLNLIYKHFLILVFGLSIDNFHILTSFYYYYYYYYFKPEGG